ncbi:MAG: undecaprenyl-diphosphate phosphatase [Bacteroidales bacterium]
MSYLEALLLGIIQGLTEFLPVSSSGHLELGKAILGVEFEQSLTFTIVVHGATVLSTIVIFWHTLIKLAKDLFEFRWNESTRYVAMLLFSAIPVFIIGMFFKDQVESLFDGRILFVGIMLLVTATLLGFTFYAKSKDRGLNFRDAFVIGIAQAVAVLPGISRAGSTIATALLLGNNRKEAAQFSFLMVLLPILGANFLDILEMESAQVSSSFGILAIGFVAAFVSGLLACKWMLKLVQRGKLIYFAIYCAVVGAIAIFAAL